MAKKVRLRDVTADNWEEVVDLEVSDEQEDFVADNAYSLAESKFDPYVKPRAIYAGKRVVGFLMYESLESDGRPHDYSIYRLMIVSGSLSPPCNARFEPQDASRLGQIGSHIWSTI